MMGASWRRVLYSVGVVTGSLLFLSQIWRGYQDINRTIFHVAFFEMFAAAGCLIVLAFGLQTVAWSHLMRRLGTRLRWSQVVAGYTLSFLPRYIPGSIWGYLSRSQWLYQTHDVPYSVSNLGSLLEIVVSITTASVMIGAYGISISGGLTQIVLALVVSGVPFAIWLILNRIARWSLVPHLLADKFEKNALLRITLADWALVIILYLLLWACYGASILALVQAFDLPERAGITTATFAFSVSWLAGFLVIFVPAGLGVRELALSNLLAMGFGLLASQASALAVISRLIISLSEVIWMLLGIILGQLGKH